jgi:hypothetical protein
MKDWAALFEQTELSPGATSEQIQLLVASISEPVTETEAREIVARQRNPFPKTDPLFAAFQPVDSREWIFPNRPLPETYLEFLQWSDGPWCANGAREFGFFGTSDVRLMMTAYEIPEYMPFAVPFALNGGGVFYLFDMREDAADGEYPVVVAAAGNLDWDAAPRIASDFVEACSGRTNVEKFL